MRSAKARISGWTYMLGFSVLAVAGWGAIKGLWFLGHPFASLVAMACVLAVAVAASLAVRGRLEEAGRAAEQFAWYWGGGGAMLFVIAGFTVIAATGAPWLELGLRGVWRPIDLVLLGALGVASAQVFGFAAAGLLWWIVRR